MDLFDAPRPLVGDPSRAHLLERVFTLAGPETRLLDAGCGTGALWEPVADRMTFRFWGMDLSAESIATAKKNLPAGSNLNTGDLRDLSGLYEDVFFDIVVATQVVYQVPDLPKALREVGRVLKPGGRFLFTTELPRRVSLREWLQDLVRRLAGGGRPRRRDAAALTALLEAAGFKVDEVLYFHVPPLKHLHNKLLADGYKNKVMKHWLALERALNEDAGLIVRGKSCFRNLYVEAVKLGAR
jgi:2-polyprenyl-3-methyl-5-hydroxy-6-metoxy-1,4-benzoquinol methylase